MALNPEFVGKTYPPSPPYEVGREKVREFATAIGDQNPAYHDVTAARALGHPDLVCPPTFPFVLGMRAMAVAMFDPDLGLNYARVVHGEQRFVYARPLCAGDEVTVTTSIEEIRQAAGNDLLTTRSEVDTVDGEHVVTLYNVIVSRGTAAGEEG
ncbi:MAG: MaoC family dehydratase N-terminal domain-containing protein [Candidatus Nanopelagicales bacterium]